MGIGLVDDVLDGLINCIVALACCSGDIREELWIERCHGIREAVGNGSALLET